jgi:hypothetical protein
MVLPPLDPRLPLPFGIEESDLLGRTDKVFEALSLPVQETAPAAATKLRVTTPD